MGGIVAKNDNNNGNEKNDANNYRDNYYRQYIDNMNINDGSTLDQGGGGFSDSDSDTLGFADFDNKIETKSIRQTRNRYDAYHPSLYLKQDGGCGCDVMENNNNNTQSKDMRGGSRVNNTNIFNVSDTSDDIRREYNKYSNIASNTYDDMTGGSGCGCGKKNNNNDESMNGGSVINFSATSEDIRNNMIGGNQNANKLYHFSATSEDVKNNMNGGMFFNFGSDNKGNKNNAVKTRNIVSATSSTNNSLYNTESISYSATSSVNMNGGCGCGGNTTATNTTNDGSSSNFENQNGGAWKKKNTNTKKNTNAKKSTKKNLARYRDIVSNSTESTMTNTMTNTMSGGSEESSNASNTQSSSSASSSSASSSSVSSSSASSSKVSSATSSTFTSNTSDESSTSSISSSDSDSSTNVSSSSSSGNKQHIVAEVSRGKAKKNNRRAYVNSMSSEINNYENNGQSFSITAQTENSINTEEYIAQQFYSSDNNIRRKIY